MPDLLSTPLCRTLRINVPIIQAPIGRVSGPALAAAVSNAGALGMLGVSYLDPEAVRSRVLETRERTSAPFGVNFLLRWDQHARVDAALEGGARLVSLFWADREPIEPYVRRVHEAGGLVMDTIGSAREAAAARDAGVDILVAQGSDAGGHVWGSVGTLSLIPAVVDAAGDVPVVAAGGIGDGRGLVAALALGAQAAWMGTAFVVADEAMSDPSYRDRVIAARETDAVLTEGVFDLGFEDAPVRTLENSTIRSWRIAGSPPSGQRPGEGQIVARRTEGPAVVRYDFAPPTIEMEGDLEALPHYAGQSAGVVRERRPAADIVRATADQARAIMSRWREPPT